MNSVKSGSIVLFHNDLENTTEAIPQILEQLSQKGYEFVPVSELIYTEITPSILTECRSR